MTMLHECRVAYVSGVIWRMPKNCTFLKQFFFDPALTGSQPSAIDWGDDGEAAPQTIPKSNRHSDTGEAAFETPCRDAPNPGSSF